MRYPQRFPSALFLAALVTAIAWLALSALLPAEELVYPDDVFRPYYFVDVTKAPYNIDNTGKTDVTVPLRAAINDIFHQGQPSLRQKTLYFPNGIYRISDTLDAMGADKSGKMMAVHRLVWTGQSRDKTILKLDDHLPGFQDPAHPKGMIRTESIGHNGNDAYDNTFMNLTLDVGAGNPGAAGVDYLTSNTGEMHDVLIRAAPGSGFAGLMMNRAWPGPAFVKNLEVDGFSYGVQLTHMEYSFTFEHLTLKNQEKAGFLNQDNGAYIRDLESTNTVPAVTNSSAAGLVVLIDSKLQGGDPKAVAIQNGGGVFLRNVEIAGYGQGVVNTGKDAGPGAAAGNIAEYTSQPVLVNKDFPSSRQTSLNLEIRETPHYENNDFSTWYSVGNKTKPDTGNVDQADAIQAAIDEAAKEGKTTLYFIPGQYVIGHTLAFHGSIRRVLGLGTVIRTLAGGMFQTPASEMPPPASTPAVKPPATTPPTPEPSPSAIKNDYGPPVFKVADIDGPDIEFCRFKIQPQFTAVGKVTCYGVQQATAKTLILHDFESDSPVYRSTDGVGDLYLETGVGNGWFFDHPGQHIWARQLDPEGSPSPKVLNVGSKLWVLGLKTERPGTQVDSQAGAETEVLGGLFYPVRVPNDDPIFRVENSRFSASYLTIANGVTPDFPRQVLEIRGDKQAAILAGDTYPRPCFGGGRAALVPLVVAAPGEATPVSAK